MKYILIFILVLYGCSSTTTKTESEVDRAQFILLPESNKKDVDDIKLDYLKGLSFKYVKRMEEVINYSIN